MRCWSGHYTIETSAALRDGDWSTRPGYFRGEGKDGLMEVFDKRAPGQLQNFYRIVGEVAPFPPQQ